LVEDLNSEVEFKDTKYTCVKGCKALHFSSYMIPTKAVSSATQSSSVEKSGQDVPGQ